MKNEAAHEGRNKLRAFSLQRLFWIVIFIVSAIYASSIIIISLSFSPILTSQYIVHFESADIDLTAVPIETFNPSFELSDGQLVGWQPVTWSGFATFYLSSNMSRTGEHSALISASSTASAALVTDNSRKYSVIPGETYLASAWVTVANISNGDGAMISIAWFDSDDAYITTTRGSSLSNASSWTKIFASGQAPPGANSAKLELHLHGIGLVWYDDVSFSHVITEYGVSGSWNVSRQGLEGARLTANADSLTLEGTFAYSSDEKLTYTLSLDLDTSEYSFITLDYKTSSANGSGLLIVLNYADGTKVITYGTSFSVEWTVIYIDPRKTPGYMYYVGNRQIVPGKQLSSIELSLDDRPDAVSSGTYKLQIRNIVFHRFVTQDFLFLGESVILLILLIALGIRGLEPMRSHDKCSFLLMFGGTVSFVAATARFLLPLSMNVGLTGADFYLILQLIGSLTVLFGMIAISISSTHFRNNSKEKVANKFLIFWMIGLVLIPSIGFLIRVNNAITLPMFDDELSCGLTAWGLTRWSFVGLNLAKFSPEAQSLIETGYFKVQPWPKNLPVPFTSTALYPDFTIVEPYFAQPFLGPLIVAPFITFFGFNAFSIRLPFILFSVATAILIFLLAARKGHIMSGLIGSSFFSFVPYITHYGSEAFLDNILAFFFMLSVYFIVKYSEATGMLKRERYIYMSVTFAAFCALIKIQGVFVLLFLLVSLYALKCTKKIMLHCALLYIALILPFPITGFLVSPQAFLQSLKGIVSVEISYIASQTPATDLGVFSFFDVLRDWSVVIALLCIVYLLAENVSEERLLLWGAVSWILYGLLFSCKEWHLLSFFAIAALIVGYVLSDLVTKQKHMWTVLLMAFLLIPSLEKRVFSLLQMFAFMAPLVLMIFGTAYLERNSSNYSKQAKNLLSCLIVLYIIVAFMLMIVTSWNYKYWA